MHPKTYSKIAVVIEEESGWSVSFTDSNPQREDCVDCATEADAFRLKQIWDSQFSLPAVPAQ